MHLTYVASHEMTWCMGVWCTQNAPRRAAVPCGTNHASAVSTPHFGGHSNMHYKKLVTQVESHASAVILLESGEQRYIKAINNNRTLFYHYLTTARVSGSFYKRVVFTPPPPTLPPFLQLMSCTIVTAFINNSKFFPVSLDFLLLSTHATAFRNTDPLFLLNILEAFIFYLFFIKWYRGQNTHWR